MLSIIHRLKITLILTILCVVFTFKFYYVFVAAYMNNIPLDQVRVGLIPALGLKQDLLVLFTSLFYHAGFPHLLSNLPVLIFLGCLIEWTEGSKKMLFLSVGSGILGNVLTLMLLRHDLRGHVGFSGSLCGMMVYFLCLVYSDQRNKNKSGFDWSVAAAFVLFLLPNFVGMAGEFQGAKLAVSPLGHFLGAVGGFVFFDLLNNGVKTAPNQFEPKTPMETRATKPKKVA